MGSMATMKAVQWDQTQKKVVINTLPVPSPGPNQILIKMASASLCASDLMSIGMEIPGRTTVTLGHEGAGFVHKLGPGAENKGFSIGAAIGTLYIIGACYACEGCMVHNNHCQTSTSHVQGFTFDGFFAEYALTDYQSAIVLPPTLDVKTASPLFCAGITAYNCVSSCELSEGSWLGIVGCGGLGQFATQYAKAMGARVVCLDISDAALETCKGLGADAVFNSRSDEMYAEGVRKLTGKGLDAVAVFSNAQAAYSSATPLLRLGGLLLVAGLVEGGVKLDCLDIARGTYRVKGDSTGIPRRMPEAVEFTARHNIKPIVEVYSSLEDVPDMIEKMKKGQSTKRMVVSL